MKDGIIRIDTSRAKQLGFTSDKFTDDSYLWKVGDAIYISLIQSKERGKGNFRALVHRILSNGWTVKVPTPLGRMQEILIKNRYQPTLEQDKEISSPVDVWVLKPAKSGL